MDRQTLGRRGEAAAANWLEESGMDILERNWRCRAGEIDLVALDGTTLVFCEVKTRRTRRAGAPEAAVGALKQAQLARVGRHYLARAGLQDMAVRFDVVAIDVVGERAFARHIPSAFIVA